MRRLAYVLPTVYLVVVFTIFQAITLSSTRVDPDNPAPPVPLYAYVLTLPWSVFSSYFKGNLVYLPMVAGAPLNAGILYVLLGGWRKR
jgi:hypothetical protein